MREKQIKFRPKSQKFEVFDNFLNAPLVSGSFFSPFNFVTTFTGTGAGIQQVQGDATDPGIISLLTGTAQTFGAAAGAVLSRTAITTQGTVLVPGAADMELEFLIRPSVLAVELNDWESWLGFGNNATGAPNDGIYVYFDWGNASGAFWQCICRSSTSGAGTTTVSKTPQTLSWTKCNIKLLKTGSAIFTFNDSDVVTISTNIPVTTGIQFVMSKYRGTTNESMQLGYAKFAWSR